MKTPPAEIRLTFSEGVEPRFSTIAVANAAGAAVALGSPETAPGNETILVAKLPGALPPGTYRVTWHAVSVDTHRTEGSFTFTVSP